MGGLGPVIKNGSANNHHASLSFRIVRTAGDANIDSGLITMSAGNDEDSAVSDAISQLSVRVVHVLTKERAPDVD